MDHSTRVNSMIVGTLFILTMFAGMVDAYWVSPVLQASSATAASTTVALKIGVFALVFLSLGVVVIATALFPVVRRHNEMIAVTYVGFRIVECILLLVGAVLYLLILGEEKASLVANPSIEAENMNFVLLVFAIKSGAYQLSMLVLGIGSLLLNYSFYKSEILPRWLSVWGALGYLLLALSAILALLGIVDTVEGPWVFLYIPGGLWELIVFPLWLIVRGFQFEVR